MSKIQTGPRIEQVKEEDQMRYIGKFFQDVVSTVNGGLQFSSNFDGQERTVNFSIADVDTAVPITLNRPANGYVVISLSAAMIIYSGQTPSTQNILYLRSSAPGTARIFVL